MNAQASETTTPAHAETPEEAIRRSTIPYFLAMNPGIGGTRHSRKGSAKPSNTAVGKAASASEEETAAQAGHVSNREKFRIQVHAVTKAAEAADPQSKETFSVSHFIFLPLNSKRVRFHKTFLRDSCRSFPFTPLHIFAPG